MSLGTSEVDKLLAQLAEDAKALNPDVFHAYGDKALTVWSEGGEWPAYADDYVKYRPDVVLRDLDEVEYINPGEANAFARLVAKGLDEDGIVGITMDCGKGKSTSLMRELYNMKLSMKTIVVQPSLSTARALHQYVATLGVASVFARNAVELPSGRALVYTNAGAAVDMILRGRVTRNDVIVVDEAHCATFTHGVLRDLLSRMEVRLVVMTASTTVTMRGLRGVKLVAVDNMTPEVSDGIAANRKKAVTVGVYDDMSYATPANAIVGVTLDLRCAYDTGLRPDPRILRGALAGGERKALPIEILQTIGRLGRLGKGGTAYYTPNAKAMNTEGLPLYDVLERAMRAAVRLQSGGLSMEKGIRCWKRSGMIGGAETPTDPVDIAASIVRRETPPSYTSVAGTQVPSYAVDLESDDDEPLLPKRVMPIARQRGFSSGGSSANSRSSSTLYHTPVDVAPKGYSRREYTVKPDEKVELKHRKEKYKNAAEGEHLISVLHEQDMVATGVFGRRQVADGPGTTKFLISVLDRGGKPSEMAVPDPGWRPFRRSADLSEKELDAGSGVAYFVAKLLEAHDRGDYIYPSIFPKVFEEGVPWQDKMDARLVLAKRLQPAYSEQEMMAVLREWNIMARATKGRAAEQMVIDQFVTYFINFLSWNRNTPVDD